MRKLLLQGHFLGLGFALLLLFVVSLGAYEIGVQYYAYAERTREANTTLANLKDLLDDVRVAEGTQLAALLTGEEIRQPSFLAAVRGIKQRTGYLAALRDNRDQQRLRTLQQSVEQFRFILNQLAASPRPTVPDQKLRLQITTLAKVADQIQADERTLENEEQELAFWTRRSARGYARASQLTATLGCAAIFAIVLFSTARIQKLLFELKKMNVSLAQAADEFRQLADGVPQFVWKTTASGTLEYVNRRWLDFCGLEPWQSRLHPDERQAFEETWGESRAQGTPLTLECRLCSEHHHGSLQYSWYLFRASPLDDKRTGERNWYCTFTDIGNQKLVEAALQRANEDLLQFAHAAAHDLQEPLRNISTSLGLLERKNPEIRGDPRMSPIRDSIDNAQRMFRMVQDLLAFAKADFVTSKSLVEADRVLERATQNLRESIAEAGGLDLKAAPLPRIFMDEVQLLQVFQNLLGNSLKYRKPGERVRVEVSALRAGDDWVFAFSDHGIGFDQRYAKLIFGVFKRLHNQNEYRGNGMGLAICSRIISSNGGRIWAEGEEGVGARFFFTIPAGPLTSDVSFSLQEETEMVPTHEASRVLARQHLRGSGLSS